MVLVLEIDVRKGLSWELDDAKPKRSWEIWGNTGGVDKGLKLIRETERTTGDFFIFEKGKENSSNMTSLEINILLLGSKHLQPLWFKL